MAVAAFVIALEPRGTDQYEHRYQNMKSHVYLKSIPRWRPLRLRTTFHVVVEVLVLVKARWLTVIGTVWPTSACIHRIMRTGIPIYNVKEDDNDGEPEK